MRSFSLRFIAAAFCIFLSYGALAADGIDSSGDTLPINVKGLRVMTLKDTGNVGIGTTVPVSKLTISQDEANDLSNIVSGQLKITGSTNTNKRLALGFDTTSNYGYIEAAEYGVAWRNFALQPYSGNVGIGTTEPAGKLDVQGGRSYFAPASEQYGVGVKYIATGGAVYFGATSSSATPDAAISNAGGTTLMTLKNGGNVGIKTTNPLSTLSVGGDGVFSAGIYSKDPGTDPGRNYGIYTDGGNFGIYSKGGNYGIFTEGGSYGVHSTGGAYGLYGKGSSYGVYGWAKDGSYGVYGRGGSFGIYGEGIDYGAYGYASDGVGVTGHGKTYDFYAYGPGANYGPFTGSHEAILAYDFPKDTKPGMLVSTTGQVKKRANSLSSTLPTIKLTDKANDNTVFGVFTMIADLPSNHWYKQQSGEETAIVNALGDGCVWVTNYAGEIKNGDRIISSPIAGYGMKEDGRYPLNNIVMKITEDIDWSKATETVKYNGITYKAYLASGIYDTLSQVGFSSQETRAALPEDVTATKNNIKSAQESEIVTSLIETVKELKAANDKQTAEIKVLTARLEKIEKPAK